MESTTFENLAIVAQRKDAVAACSLPDRLHPLSANSLRAFLDNNMSEGEFGRLFSLANSDYISLSDCILSVLETMQATLAIVL